MYVIIWRYKVKPEHLDAFKSAYRADGDWAEFFRRDFNYIATRLVATNEDSHVFLTFDFWTTKDAYTRFAGKNEAEYQLIDMQFDDFMLAEEKVGSFEIDREEFFGFL